MQLQPRPHSALSDRRMRPAAPSHASPATATAPPTPGRCLRTAWSATAATPLPAGDAPSPPSAAVPSATAAESPDDARLHEEKRRRDDAAADHHDLATSSFMSFEEWKELQLKKAGQDPADLKARKHHERDRDDYASAHNDLDSIGDDGEINLDFDALSEKVSEITASGGRGDASSAVEYEQQPQETHNADEDVLLYEGDGTGAAQYTRSKDAGKTCKERFSYASFDAGAAVLKTGPRAKNAKAILVENKDSYMLLECAQKNKFVIIELSDDILVDTVVLANFEFFSSMVRTFRVSVSDRYPVKLEKWKDLGTFEARNQRDIQAFLVEHPQIWAKYMRIEFLTHYGTEYYCPISLVRVHGTRMIDSWKEAEGGRDDDDEALIESEPHDHQPEPAEPNTQEEQQETVPPTSEQEPQPPGTVTDATTATTPAVVTEMGLSPWRPAFYEFTPEDVCEIPTQTVGQNVATDEQRSRSAPSHPASNGGHDPADMYHFSVPASTSADPLSRENSPPLANASLADPAASSYPDPASSSSQSQPSSAQSSSQRPKDASQPSSATHRSRPESPHSGQAKAPTSVSKPSSQATNRASAQGKASTAVPSSSRNRTGTNTGAAAASPTVQESFFKTVAKRLQLLESNTSLSLQYIEDQSRFLQEALTKMERKQISRVDAFLDGLNRTVLAELRSVRQQYDQIWQSTVIALESQRDQSQREIVALSSRLNVLADEVVFQKRMAILQSLLLLACLGLIVFSRGFGGPAASSSSTFVGSSAYRPWTAWPTSPPPSAGMTPMRGGADDSPLPSPSPSPPRRGNDPSTPRGPRGTPAHIRLHSIAYSDKTLPLTPTSEYGDDGDGDCRRRRDTNPSIHVVDESGASSFFDDTSSFETPHKSDGDRGGDTSGESLSGSDGVVPAADIIQAGVGLQENTPPPEEEEEEEDIAAAGGREESEAAVVVVQDLGPNGLGHDQESGPPLARTGMSQFVDSRKPLPALPEDP
ncbi:hypothetical protein MAPG_07937 [Magnaporthiopsis poae ATCC 64411]|uniref:SUN domain-containing protein n=1 Tax=Magnaporthiopsis poae (strain ATCC 64411 / 73-15) TaxID=644358 RepID=A0A0C4E608_MAGP6|nr:hypothetical protein MAPG_07937 [Magnaporthiopsis poae ATCC 64411]